MCATVINTRCDNEVFDLPRVLIYLKTVTKVSNSLKLKIEQILESSV